MLESLFNKVAGPKAWFPVNIVKIFKDTFFTEQLRWLLLIILDLYNFVLNSSGTSFVKENYLDFMQI